MGNGGAKDQTGKGLRRFIRVVGNGDNRRRTRKTAAVMGHESF